MRQKNILKLTAATFAIIGAGTIFFYLAAETTLAANNGKVEKVPTSYQVSDSPETVLPQSEIEEESGEKTNYSVSMDSLNTGTPTGRKYNTLELNEIRVVGLPIQRIL